MNTITTFLIALFLSVCVTYGQDLAITMTTARPLGSEFTFSLGSKIDNTPIKVDFGDGKLVDYTIGTSLSNVSGMLVGSQILKVYGSGIAYFTCVNNRLVTLDVAGDADLVDLFCYGNQLGNLDVTKNTELVNFDCSFNQLTAIDVSKNTKLNALRCDNNQITTLDIVNNTSMWSLSCSNNYLNTIDISMVKTLMVLDCSNNQFTSLDISSNNLLNYFQCHHNKLTSLDVSKNPLLYDLNCSDNELTNLDLSQNTSLTSVSLENNQFTFTSLPQRQLNWTQFSYAPQTPISIVKSIKIGTALDLGSQAIVNNDSTVYTWKTTFGTTLVPGIDYLINNGKTTFLKTQKYFVYCEMSNASFPDFTDNNALKTSYTEIKDTSTIIGEPSVISMTTSKSIGSDISFDLQAASDSTFIKVDFGDGNLVNQVIGASSSTIHGNVVGSQNIIIYGTALTYLGCNDQQLTALNVSMAPSLISLVCDRNQLTELDVSKNKGLLSLSCSDNKLTSLSLINNAMLFSLTCTNNLLSTLDVSKSTQLSYLLCFYNQLSTLDITNNPGLLFVFCYNNKLTSLDVSKNSSLLYLYCFNNPLTSLDLTNNTRLMDLSCFADQLTSLNLTKNTWLRYLNCMNNQLTSLDLTQNIALTGLTCNDNQLTSLDLTKNIRLTSLTCNNNKLTDLDVTQNAELGSITCNNNKLTNLDLSQNAGLRFVSCDNNQFVNLDISHNTGLNFLSCNNNQLTSLDVSQNNTLYNLYCSGNNMNFTTLPAIQSLFYEYKYAPQKAVFIPKSIIVGDEIDLSDQLQVNGITTVYNWKTQNGATLAAGTDYTFSGGKTVFLKAQADSVYCEMTNTSFPDLSGANVFRTINTKVMEQPTVVMTTAKTIGSRFSFKLKASADNIPVNVDFGNGIMIPKVVGASWLTIKGTLVGSQIVKVYGVGIKGLDCSSDRLIALDVSKSVDLTKLDCSNNRLSTLDLSKNTTLVKLVCSDNQLSSLDISNNSMLLRLDCSNNYLSFATLPFDKATWKSFIYAPQKPISIVKILNVNVELDLSRQFLVNGDTTVYTWKTQHGKLLSPKIDYMMVDGKTVFLKKQRDSVYCEMTNEMFPDFSGCNVLKTNNVKILGSNLKESSEIINDNIGRAIINDICAQDVNIYTRYKTLYIDITYKADVSIFDVNGRLILSKCLNIGTNDVDLKNSGVYIVKIVGTEGQVTRKVMIE